MTTRTSTLRPLYPIGAERPETPQNNNKARRRRPAPPEAASRSPSASAPAEAADELTTQLAHALGHTTPRWS
ncbi:hypothetical protein [Actinoplanes subtropicus]|uniref:hypothetical protein n=1 Tax=Actinoplanes subtropicus TaxID=543632 RepID=UPI0012F8BF78|nr:hypothetical protein [Actinoplanes subtropicus]